MFSWKKNVREKTMKSRPSIHTYTLYTPKKWEFDWKIDTGRQRLMSMTPIATECNDAKPQKGTLNNARKNLFFFSLSRYYALFLKWHKRILVKRVRIKKLVEPFTKLLIKNLAFEHFSNRMKYNFFGWIKPINQSWCEFTHKIQFQFYHICFRFQSLAAAHEPSGWSLNMKESLETN